jgi:DNA polymerase III delta prime subunit
MDFSAFPEHHAVLVVTPDREPVFASFQAHFPAPFHKHLVQTVIDIDTAREISSWSKAGIQGENGSRAYVISFHTITLPAQNALLKVLEEPQIGVRFIFVTSNKERLIGTVLSRMHAMQQESDSSDEESARDFLRAQSSVRMKLPSIVQLLAREDEEGRKDREATKGFILSLLSVMKEKNIESRYILETIEIASYASDPSASGKALLEYLALLLPTIK